MAKRRRDEQETKGTPKPKRTAHLQFLPTHSVFLVTGKGPIEVLTGEVSPSQVGWKALGLSVLPNEWAPPFFVISARCFEEKIPLNTVNGWSSNLQTRLGLASDSRLMLRSSGTAETMLDRGSLISELSPSAAIASSVEQLREKLSAPSRPLVHWVVQQAVEAKRKGHLSNERHVSREPRDWVVELEITDDYPGQAIPIGIRSWREGGNPSSLDLSCNSEAEIPFRLRQVAKWAIQFTKRIHFEWVWDGKRLWIVQADAAEPTHGVNPIAVLPSKIETPNVKSLRIFRPAEPSDYERYVKLRNAALYRQFGYDMPPFFIADDYLTIAHLLSGTIPTEMERDLEELLKRPLIIRTEGSNIPNDKREMLPRSDRLSTFVEAKEWLLSFFRPEIGKLDLASRDLCIVAHHFIPSVASAWARAEPGHRIVRIESLWGIPEGLYWYSHDTIEVDTREVKLKKTTNFSGLPFSTSHRIRYKGTFVTADEF